MIMMTVQREEDIMMKTPHLRLVGTFGRCRHLDRGHRVCSKMENFAKGK